MVVTIALGAVVAGLAVANYVVYKNHHTLKNGAAHMQTLGKDQEVGYQKNQIKKAISGLTQTTNGNGTEKIAMTNGNANENGTGLLVAQRLSSIQATLSYLDRRTETIQARLNRIENIIATNGNANAEEVKQLLQESFTRKIENMEEFKRNTEIEIQAIKDHLHENKESIENQKKTEMDKEMEDRIRNLVFNVHE